MKVLKDLQYYVLVFGMMCVVLLYAKLEKDENKRESYPTILVGTSTDSTDIDFEELEDSIINTLKY